VKAVDLVTSEAFQAEGFARLLVVGYNSAEILDWVTFVSKGTSRIVSGVKIDQMNSMNENFQLKKARVRGTVFERIHSSLGGRRYPNGFELAE